MPKRITFTEGMLYEEASRVRQAKAYKRIYETDARELEELSTSRTIINFLRKNKYKVDIVKPP